MAPLPKTKKPTSATRVASRTKRASVADGRFPPGYDFPADDPLIPSYRVYQQAPRSVCEFRLTTELEVIAAKHRKHLTDCHVLAIAGDAAEIDEYVLSGAFRALRASLCRPA